ncbi:CPA [Ectocarpus sp. CCAP 1310/34]|nr:CPA [Ectocarpus sp. CCAP 1310/34]
MATPRLVTVAATQMSCSPDTKDNVDAAEALVRRAAAAGAQVILLQELFSTRYFCQEQREEHFLLAENPNESALLARFQALAEELGVVLPISFFERGNNAFFNSVVVFDADGRRLGLYRKSHIPDGPGYQEKFYFNPGDTGFKVFDTQFGKIGVAICWDQWFPEAARSMALQGAELLLYPTAIGSEPQDPTLNSSAHWRRVMQGHAGANLVPVVASNRVGREEYPGSHITFYGSSFIADQTGEIVVECSYVSSNRGESEGGNGTAIDASRMGAASAAVTPGHSRHFSCGEPGGPGGEIILHTFDLEGVRLQRAGWGLFRDRRPSLYRPLLSLDGRAAV